MTFDEYGGATPYGQIMMSIDRAENELVDSFAPGNDRRKALWVNLMTYNSRLRALFGVGWEQWIDGSFVMEKKEPNDIDIANLIHYNEDLNQKLGANYNEGQFLFRMDENAKSGSWDRLGIDAYLIPVYPEGHPMYARYLKERAYWHKTFSKNESTGQSKGYVCVVQI